MLGHGSNPVHGDAERKGAATQCAEVFALPGGDPVFTSHSRKKAVTSSA
jgi:hypothetical protein